MSSGSSDARRRAENELWHALEERRVEIRAAKLGFSERQHNEFRKAHAEGRLLEVLCKSMENYKGPDPYYARPMAEAIRHDLETWEHVLIRAGAPWSPFVTAAARRGAKACIRDAEDFARFP